MQKRSDDRLIAYLDGELEMAERREIEAWLEHRSGGLAKACGTRRIGKPGAPRL